MCIRDREYMEHSNFYAMCDKIRKMEARELHLALEAHGGEFVWINDENDEEELYDPPIILVNLNDGPMDVVIHKVWSVSYTHLDVYKRQTTYCTNPEG